jgi:hypothetical protein
MVGGASMARPVSEQIAVSRAQQWRIVMFSPQWRLLQVTRHQ